jgi:hypothetical protein
VRHVIFSYKTREETTVGHVVVCTMLSGIMCRLAIHMGSGDKKGFTKLISISMEKPLIVRHHSDLLTIIAVVIRGEITYGFL